MTQQAPRPLRRTGRHRRPPWATHHGDWEGKLQQRVSQTPLFSIRWSL